MMNSTGFFVNMLLLAAMTVSPAAWGQEDWTIPGPDFVTRPPLPNTDTEKHILQVIDAIREEQGWMWNITKEDGRLLRLLVEATNAKNVVEIGTSNGYSSLWLGLGLLTTNGKLTTFEIDAHRAALARKNFVRAGVDHIITVVEGDAHEEIAMLHEPVDILFLDADKSGYIDYLTRLLPLVRSGGLILADNMNSPSPDPRYVDAITTDPALETVFVHMYGWGIGMTLKKR